MITKYDEMVYDRQKKLNLIKIEEAVVVGCGGTGTWVAIFLAMSGAKKLHLMDSDDLELTNLNRLPFAEESIGMKKTEVVKTFLEKIRPDIRIETYPNADTLTLGLISGTHMFDCTDLFSVQQKLYKWCGEKKMIYTRVGYDGTHVTVSGSVPSWTTSTDDERGYATVASWSCPAAFAATLGVARAMLDPKMEISMDINDCGKKK